MIFYLVCMVGCLVCFYFVYCNCWGWFGFICGLFVWVDNLCCGLIWLGWVDWDVWGCLCCVYWLIILCGLFMCWCCLLVDLGLVGVIMRFDCFVVCLLLRLVVLFAVCGLICSVAWVLCYLFDWLFCFVTRLVWVVILDILLLCLGVVTNVWLFCGFMICFGCLCGGLF